jgi:hypothetical protein
MTKQITLTLDRETIETVLRSVYQVPAEPEHTITWDLPNQRIIIAATTQAVDVSEEHPHVSPGA